VRTCHDRDSESVGTASELRIMITAALANHPPIGSVLVVRGVDWRPLATLDPPEVEAVRVCTLD